MGRMYGVRKFTQKVIDFAIDISIASQPPYRATKHRPDECPGSNMTWCCRHLRCIRCNGEYGCGDEWLGVDNDLMQCLDCMLEIKSGLMVYKPIRIGEILREN